jgi:hypothetical protein
VGKSTVLTALRIFFRDAAGSPTDLVNLQDEDFHGRDTSKEIVITVTFSDLEPEAQEDFAHYFRQGKLVVSAVAKWDGRSRTAEVKQFGERFVMREFADFFEADTARTPVAELKEIYAKIRQARADLPAAASKTAMQEALHTYENAHPEACELMPGQDEFYGFTKGANRLQKYVQWVFVPAVKDASSEQMEAKRTALGRLLELTVRSKTSFSGPIAGLRSEVEARYGKLLQDHQGLLEELSESLSGRMQEWAHPDATLRLSWRSDAANISITEPHAEVSAGEGRFQGTLARFGHGLQRSFLLALLQELSGCRDTGNPKLLLACEEPELYQHPPQARYLASVLQKLSAANSQVIVSTHSPYFISGTGFRDVRVMRHEMGEDQPVIRRATLEELSEKLTEALGQKPVVPTGVEFKIEQALQPSLNEMFFSQVLILVEGQEDFGFVSAYFTLTDRTEDYRRLGCHIVPTSGKGRMVEPLAIARILGIPTFVIFDADGDDIERRDRRLQHERDNLALLRLCSVASPIAFPTAIFETPNLIVWPTRIGTVIREEMGQPEWERYERKVREKRNIVDVPDLKKNALFIGTVLAEAYQDGKQSTILEGLCDRIVAFARSVHSRPAARRVVQPEPAEPA